MNEYNDQKNNKSILFRIHARTVDGRRQHLFATVGFGRIQLLVLQRQLFNSSQINLCPT